MLFGTLDVVERDARTVIHASVNEILIPILANWSAVHVPIQLHKAFRPEARCNQRNVR